MTAGPTSPDAVSLAVFFAVGLFGGAHCLGMCGPLVTVYADRLDEPRGPTWREIRQHALFNAGRTAGYAAIGAAMGLAGALAFGAAAVVSMGDAVRAAAGIAVGVAIIAAGIGYAARGTNAFARVSVPGLSRVHDAITARIDGWVDGPRIAALGALHGLLPCPLLYPAFLYAFARGSPAGGALSLGALGAGTFPALFLYGTAFGSLPSGRRRTLHRALGVTFVALGYLPLSMGLAVVGIDLPRVPVPFYQPLTS